MACRTEVELIEEKKTFFRPVIHRGALYAGDGLLYSQPARGTEVRSPGKYGSGSEV